MFYQNPTALLTEQAQSGFFLASLCDYRLPYLFTFVNNNNHYYLFFKQGSIVSEEVLSFIVFGFYSNPIIFYVLVFLNAQIDRTGTALNIGFDSHCTENALELFPKHHKKRDIYMKKRVDCLNRN